MTVASNPNKITHIANGVATQFSYNFKIFEKAHARVVITNALGNETDVAQNNFSITGLGEEAGGIVTYGVGSPLATGNKLTILRELPLTQTIALTNQTSVKPEAMELGLDKAVQMIQQIDEKVNRGVQGGVAENNAGIIFPSPVEGKFLRWSSILGQLENADAGGGGISLPIPQSGVTGLIADLAGKAALSHTHSQSSITNLVADLAARPLAASLGALAFLGTVATANIADANVTTAKLADNAVTYAKMQTGAPDTLIGYGGAGNAGNVTLGAGLSLSGGVLSASGGGGATDYADLTEVTLDAIGGGFGNQQTFTIPPDGRLAFTQTTNPAGGVASILINKTCANAGTSGVTSGIRSVSTIQAGYTNIEWAILGMVQSYATSNEHTGVYGQATGYASTRGSIFGMVAEAHDYVNGATNALIGMEVDCFGGSGVDTARNRIGLNIVVGKGEEFCPSGLVGAWAGTPDSETFAGLYFTNTAKGYYRNAIYIGNDTAGGGATSIIRNAIRIDANENSSGGTAIWDSGSKTIGIALAGSYSGAAITIPSNSRIGMNGTSSIGIGYNTGTSAVEVNTNFTVGGNITATGAVIGTTQIETSGIRLNSDGLIQLLSTARYSNGGYGTLFFNGQSYAGRFIQVSIPGRGVDAYIPIMVSNTSNAA